MDLRRRNALRRIVFGELPWVISWLAKRGEIINTVNTSSFKRNYNI